MKRRIQNLCILLATLGLCGCRPDTEVFGIYVDSLNITGRPAVAGSDVSIIDMAYYHFKRITHKGEMTPGELLAHNLEYMEKSGLYYGKSSLQYAAVLSDVGISYMNMGRYFEAIPYLERSENISLELVGETSVAYSNAAGNLGDAFYHNGMYEEAIKHELLSLTALEGHNNRKESLIGAYNNLGNAYGALNNNILAIDYHKKSLDLSNEILGKESRASLVQRANLSANLYDGGHIDEALRILTEGIDLLDKSRDKEARLTKPVLLVRIRQVKLGLHDYIGAYEAAKQALEEKESFKSSNKTELLEYLTNLLMICLELGDREGILKYAIRSEAIAREYYQYESIPYAFYLGNLAFGYFVTGDKKNGNDALMKAMHIYDISPFTPPEKAFENLITKARLKLSEGDTDGAENFLKKATQNFENNDHDKTAIYNVLSLQRDIAFTKEESSKGRSSASRETDIHKISRSYGYKMLTHIFENKGFFAPGEYNNNVAFCLNELASSAKSKDLNIFFLKLYVNRIQANRDSMKLLGKEVLSKYTDNYRSAYTNLANLLSDKGRSSEALQVLSMLKEDEQYQYTRRSGLRSKERSSIKLTVKEAGLETIILRLEDRANLLAQRISDLHINPHLTQHEILLETTLSKELEATKLSVENSLEVYFDSKQVKYDFNKYSLPDNSIKNNKAIAENDKDTAFIVFWLSENELNSITSIGRNLYTKKISLSQEVKQLMGPEFTNIVSDLSIDPKPASSLIYKAMIAPIREILDIHKIKTLAISLHGSLRYVPMGALFDGQNYLIENYSLPIVNETHQKSILVNSSSQPTISAMGVSKSINGFPALPHVEEELQAVAYINGGEATVNKILIDDRFTKKSLEESLNSGFNIIHIATHFLFSPGTEENSFLLLGDGSTLSLAELREDNVHMSNVRLVTLSACETGRSGGIGSDGREIDGLSGVIQRKGAQAVLATLWPVADSTTSSLMKSVYSRNLEHHLSLAESLRESQLDLILGRQQPTANKSLEVDGRKESATSTWPFAHPFYWAPFFVTGNWH